MEIIATTFILARVPVSVTRIAPRTVSIAVGNASPWALQVGSRENAVTVAGAIVTETGAKLTNSERSDIADLVARIAGV